MPLRRLLSGLTVPVLANYEQCNAADFEDAGAAE